MRILNGCGAGQWKLPLGEGSPWGEGEDRDGDGGGTAVSQVLQTQLFGALQVRSRGEGLKLHL